MDELLEGYFIMRRCICFLALPPWWQIPCQKKKPYFRNGATYLPMSPSKSSKFVHPAERVWRYSPGFHFRLITSR